MQINNTLLEKKHHYMLIMREIQILKHQIEYEVLTEESPRNRLDEVYRIFNMTFIGLLREGLAYQYIKDANNTEKDIIRITIDNIDYECRVLVLKKLLGQEFYEVLKINPDIKEEKKKETKKKLKEVTEEIENTEDDSDVPVTETESEAVVIPTINDEEEDEYQYFEEKEKNISTMFYDKWKLHVLEQGAIKGQNIELNIYPLEIKKNTLISDIVIYAKCGREIKTFVSGNDKDGRKSVNVDIGEHSFIVRGCFKQGKFETTIIPSGMTLAINAGINKEKEEIRPEDITECHDGHITYMLNEKTKIHVFPIDNINDKVGKANVVILAENDQERRLYDSYNQNVALVDDNGVNKQVVAYFTDNILNSEVID